MPEFGFKAKQEQNRMEDTSVLNKSLAIFVSLVPEQQVNL